MIRTAVPALGMLTDVLMWDGDEEELRGFAADEFFGTDPDGTAWVSSERPEVRRPLRPGDLLVRPAGRTDLVALMFFGDSPWVPLLGLGAPAS